MSKSNKIVNYDLNLSVKEHEGEFVAIARHAPIIVARYRTPAETWPTLKTPGALYERRLLSEAAVLRRYEKKHQQVAGDFSQYDPPDELLMFIPHAADAMLRGIARLSDLDG